MFDLLAAVSGLAVAFFALWAYFRYGDAFHPAVFTAPLMIGGYSIWPLLLNRTGDLEFLLGSEDLVRIQGYYLAALIAFYLAMLLGGSSKALKFRQLSPWRDVAQTIRGQQARRKLVKLAAGLGAVAMLAYWYSILNAGGFDEAYSYYKGGGRAESGYLGEAVLLAYPAALVYALTRQGRGMRARDWVIVLVILSPNLFQGTFGVRRGPLFISLAMIFVTWTVAKGRVPNIRKTALGVGLIVLAVGFMWTQRMTWFDSRTEIVESSGVERTLLPSTENLWLNDYVAGVGSALITEYYDKFFWGKRWFVDLVIRPIPRQVWPNKYEDVGAYWKEAGNPTGFSDFEQIHVLGFALPRGHSMGMLSDMYSEWQWYALFFLFLLGLLLRWLWFKHRMVGQVWTAIFLCAIGLCIYMPTQSFSAWYQRFLIMAVGTYFAWRWVVGKDVKAQRTEPRHLDDGLVESRR